MTLAQERHDPLAVLDAVIADMRASGDTGHVENLLQARAQISKLKTSMEQVMELWDSNDMSIDGEAATMKTLPEKWRESLAAFGGAP